MQPVQGSFRESRPFWCPKIPVAKNCKTRNLRIKKNPVLRGFLEFLWRSQQNK
jgi:hypothetical protein